MIVQLYVQPLARLQYIAGQRDVGAAGRGIAAGMVVHQDQRGGPQIQRAADNLTRMDRRFVDRAFADQIVANQAVLAVQMQHAHPLGGAMGHIGMQIIR